MEILNRNILCKIYSYCKGITFLTLICEKQFTFEINNRSRKNSWLLFIKNLTRFSYALKNAFLNDLLNQLYAYAVYNICCNCNPVGSLKYWYAWRKIGSLDGRDEKNGDRSTVSRSLSFFEKKIHQVLFLYSKNKIKNVCFEVFWISRIKPFADEEHRYGRIQSGLAHKTSQFLPSPFVSFVCPNSSVEYLWDKDKKRPLTPYLN